MEPLNKSSAWLCMLGICVLAACQNRKQNEPIELVNPKIGNISHLLVPTYPTVHIPNSMLRFYPLRDEYTSARIRGFPLNIIAHRWGRTLALLPYKGEPEAALFSGGMAYDQEAVTPFSYEVRSEDGTIQFNFSPASRSAIMQILYTDSCNPGILLQSFGRAELRLSGDSLTGFDSYGDSRMYVWMQLSEKPEKFIVLNGSILPGDASAEGAPLAVGLRFPAAKNSRVGIRYGVSYISVAQAKKNLQEELDGKDLQELEADARAQWNSILSKIEIEGGTSDEQVVFYTSLYRCFERMVNITEDGNYYSAWSKKVEKASDTTFYCDDWVWDTHLALHPLQVLLNPGQQDEKINSYIRMGRQSGWIPTFPEVYGDDHCMNGNHFAAVVLDAWRKGIRGFSLEEAYGLMKHTLASETRLPWTRGPANELDRFYDKKGYFPGLQPGEKESCKAVHSWEKRQSVAVTLASSYDDWCMAEMARELNRGEDQNYFTQRSRNYRNLFNETSGFYQPKDQNGEWVMPFDPRYSGGIGCRDYYDENNGWTYLWQPTHALDSLVLMMGGKEAFCDRLDQLFNEGIGMSKWQYAAIMPDASGCTGQFVMGNEPSLHIPYLYNLGGQPWKTQKTVRKLLECWFRNDLMGVPGDEDGGGLSAFYVFSAMGFYPVTAGIPEYQLGSPLFNKVSLKLEGNKTFTIRAKNNSSRNKYIQSASLNGRRLEKPVILHSDLVKGGELMLEMGDKPNRFAFNAK